MDNVEMSVSGNKLTIVVDLSKPGTVSSTGKTKLLASTRGAQPVAYDKIAGIKRR